jgi:hypothetical protein
MWSLPSLTPSSVVRQLGCEPGDPRGASISDHRPYIRECPTPGPRNCAPAMVADAGRQPRKHVPDVGRDRADAGRCSCGATKPTPPADQGRRPRSPRGRQPRAPNGAARKSTRVVSVPRRGRGPPSSPGRRQRRRPDLARGRAIGCWRRHAVAADELTQAIAEVAAYRDSARPSPHSARGSGSSPLTRVVAVFMPRSWAGRSEWLRGVRGRPMLDLDRGRLTGAWTE